MPIGAEGCGGPDSTLPPGLEINTQVQPLLTGYPQETSLPFIFSLHLCLRPFRLL